jgi:glucose-6-phosphate isomerase
MADLPFTFGVDIGKNIIMPHDEHIVRRLSAMTGQYFNVEVYEAMLREDDVILYEIYGINRPEDAGELMSGLSVVHPGKVGEEYFMTKGHFHAKLATAEVYYCLKGEGLMVMETPEGEWAVEPMRPGHVLYVPPLWAHRSINTSSDADLVNFFIYPANAGHDYGSIENQGFRKLVVETDGKPQIIDNPRWLPPEKR